MVNPIYVSTYLLFFSSTIQQIEKVKFRIEKKKATKKLYQDALASLTVRTCQNTIFDVLLVFNISMLIILPHYFFCRKHVELKRSEASPSNIKADNFANSLKHLLHPNLHQFSILNQNLSLYQT